MKIAIIREDQCVYVDGVALAPLDLSFMDQSIHAVQWKDDTGWIEYADNDDGTKPENKAIEDFSPFQPALDAWNVAKAAQDAISVASTQAAADQPANTGMQQL